MTLLPTCTCDPLTLERPTGGCPRHGAFHPVMTLGEIAAVEQGVAGITLVEGRRCPLCGGTFTPGNHTCLSASASDPVNHPSHYTAGKVECIDALEAATEGLTGIEAVCTASAIKYLWRWKRKGGHEDLAKARWYINRIIGPEA